MELITLEFIWYAKVFILKKELFEDKQQVNFRAVINHHFTMF